MKKITQARRPSGNALSRIFEQQLYVQEMTNDKAYRAAANVRDRLIRKLSKRERIQILLATGIVSRLCEDR